MTSPAPSAASSAATASVLDLTPAPVVPVVVVEDAADAAPLARALVAGGLPAIEVTLRTPAALDAIREISGAVPEAVVGAGTVITPEQVTACGAAGARFLVSPGWTDVLLTALLASGLPFLPGVSTTSEVVALLERGVREMKFFPAEAASGAAYLRSLAGPLPQALFCPTGGIGPKNALGYLALPNVGCVGGSWMVPADAVADRDWPRIESLARTASALRTASGLRASSALGASSAPRTASGLRAEGGTCR
ncbi:bifunctional 4-hydroxy-2-oxoglutarate aldolase/2-dehydro-3-deoxy-phosphogluconate aldolase [Streptomyces sp. NPDC012616]|uniref:bifunctional 4-hydroxy-2-oxoglutarate aldolase/2-dehydro-3-deoxy-phosphogluconate aldolase n=1 Tax=Streptomyces sp. NPDC012616 TaxID=3364840 RepID=UPI0036E753FF